MQYGVSDISGPRGGWPDRFTAGLCSDLREEWCEECGRSLAGCEVAETAAGAILCLRCCRDLEGEDDE